MTKLRVITGGGANQGGGGPGRHGQDQLHEKSQRLLRMRSALSEWRSGGLTPHDGYVFGFAGLAFGTVLVVGWTAYFFDIPYNAPLVTGLAAASAIAVGFITNQYNRAPRTHVDQMDRLLATYEPVSKEAYRSLQDKVKEQEGMDADLVESWLETESAALELALERQMPTEGLFLKKKV